MNRDLAVLFALLRSGEKEAVMAETHNDVIRDKHLPRVGDTVRSTKYKTLWRVIEKKEVWLNTSDDPETGDYRVRPSTFATGASKRASRLELARCSGMPTPCTTTPLKLTGRWRSKEHLSTDQITTARR